MVGHSVSFWWTGKTHNKGQITKWKCTIGSVTHIQTRNPQRLGSVIVYKSQNRFLLIEKYKEEQILL